MQNSKCPVCGLELKERGTDKDRGNIRQYHCDKCGKFELYGSSERKIKSESKLNPKISATLSYVIRKMQKKNEWPLVPPELVAQVINNPRLPSPFEQADNLIKWLGDTVDAPGIEIGLDSDRISAIIGASNLNNLNFVVDSLISQGMISSSRTDAQRPLTLTFKGWERYEELKKGEASGRKAFMAMPFGNASLDNVFMNCFKPAVKRTGFELVRLDEVPKAGLIDDRLRVEILTSRFLIAELTKGNQGAYWEAGFAEGLGKPVIYTCEQDYFNSKSTHFDTNHHLTVIWNPDNLSEAANDLVATIRATLPEEAKLGDDD
jgi:hypothetical protein